MNRIILLLLLAFAMLICANSVSAYTIDDNTLVKSYRGDNPYKWGSSYWHDVIGPLQEFNIHGIDAIYSGGYITLDMYTNFNSSGHYTDGFLHVYLADLGLDVDLDGFYEYGIALRDHDIWTQSNVAPTLEDLDSGLYRVNSWDTSSHFVSPFSNYIYGGSWSNDLTTEKIPDVAIAGVDESILGGANIDFFDLGGDGVNSPKYRCSVTIDASAINLSSGSNSVNFFWGGATCSNDAIGGTLTIQHQMEHQTSPIPEPATLVLTGFGLIGLAVIATIKKRQNCHGE